VFDRVTGKPLWPIEERKVPGSNVPGEAPSPTQPYPTAPPPHGRQKFTVDDIDPYYLTPEERAQFKDRLLSDRNEGLFTPAGFTETVEMPGNNGGSIFFTTAADAASAAIADASSAIVAVANFIAPVAIAVAAARLTAATAQRFRRPDALKVDTRRAAPVE